MGGLEWLLGRTVSRLAAVPVLEGTPRSIVEALGRAGFFLMAPALLLAAALFLISVLSAGSRFNREHALLDLALCIYLALYCVVATVIPALSDQPWLALSLSLLTLVGLWWIAVRFVFQLDYDPWSKGAVVLVAAAYTGWFYYVIQQQIAAVGQAEAGLPLLGLDLGELAAVLVPVALFGACRNSRAKRWDPGMWIAPLVAALLFSASNIVDMLTNEGFTGVLVIWSLGLRLFLPWPLYAISLALYVYTLLACFTRRSVDGSVCDANTGLAMLLLLFAGYRLMLPYLHLLAVLSLVLMTGLGSPLARRPPGESARPVTQAGSAETPQEVGPGLTV